MENTNHNLESEERLINLLGYKILGPDNSNRWKILDEDENQVGFIQYKKIKSKNVKKGIPAVFGYHTEIDSKDIKFNLTRRCDTSIFGYTLDIKRDDNFDSLEISTGKYPGLTLWSKKFGFMNFHIDWNAIYLEFKSSTEHFNTNETIVYRNDVNLYSKYKLYSYQIRYSDKEHDPNNPDGQKQNGIRIREITGEALSYQQSCNEISLSEKSWVNGKLTIRRNSTVNGTIEEMVTKHQMGIDAFQHFRYLINEILPFKQEVVSFMVQEQIGLRDELKEFIPELGSTNEEVKQKTL